MIWFFCVFLHPVMDDRIIGICCSQLHCGATMLYPTDTIWGIGCDATDAAAVEKVYSIKQRDHSKSMLILCADMAMVEDFVGPVGEKGREELLDAARPTTVILPLRSGRLASNLVAADGTIGVRIPQMDFCHRLLVRFGRPLVSTSANLSGQPSPASYAEISEVVRNAVDFCVPESYEQKTAGRPSRIVKLASDGSIVVIRD